MYIVSTSVPCPSSDTLVVMGCGEGIGLSIEELSEDQIHIFPNPNRGAFAVAWSEGLNLDHWFIYAASGQRVASGQITGVGEVAIDLDLAQGLYLVELEGAVGRFWKRVVIE
jgi:hypothetical protein